MSLIALATEDALSEQVGLQLSAEAGFTVGQRFRRNGFGYLRHSIRSFCDIARRTPVLLITDLDRGACPSRLIESWLGKQMQPEDLLFRVPVRQVESWLLADHDAMRRLLGARAKLPDAPDQLADSKRFLLALAKFAPRQVREDLTVERGAVASQGLGYNDRLSAWAEASWSPLRAAELSPSLARTRSSLKKLWARMQHRGTQKM